MHLGYEHSRIETWTVTYSNALIKGGSNSSSDRSCLDTSFRNSINRSDWLIPCSIKIAMSISPSISPLSWNDPNCTDGFDPFPGRQGKSIQTGLSSKPLEFEGFKIWIMQWFPQTKKFEGIPISHPHMTTGTFRSSYPFHTKGLVSCFIHLYLLQITTYSTQSKLGLYQSFSMTQGRFVCHVHRFNTNTTIAFPSPSTHLNWQILPHFLLNLHDQLSSLVYQQFPRIAQEDVSFVLCVHFKW